MPLFLYAPSSFYGLPQFRPEKPLRYGLQGFDLITSVEEFFCPISITCHDAYSTKRVSPPVAVIPIPLLIKSKLVILRQGTGLANLCFPHTRKKHEQVVSPFPFRSAPLSRKLFLPAETICPLAGNLDHGHKKYGNRPLDNFHVFYLRYARPVRELG